ncbi:DUF3147 family protein [Alicyclobacillaceae bacterium I2511]|nr:DUF3147 family protein [Alicyclobacillaceae bacterium I2511]
MALNLKQWIPKQWIPYILRFVIGGSAVAAVSLVAGLSPQASGVLAAFPAVFLTAIVWVRLSAGRPGAVHFAKGGIQGVLGTLLTAVTTLAVLWARGPWYFAVGAGLLAYGLYIMTIVAVKGRS